MSPPKAEVVVFEDDVGWKKFITRKLERGGHHVAGSASDPEEAITLANNLPDGTQVAIVDGNLTKEDVSGDDGNEIVAILKEKYPNVKIVGFSAEPDTFLDADVVLDKTSTTGEGLEKLSSTVDQL